MLAEIFMMRLEALLRAAANEPTNPASDKRFVPIALPRSSPAGLRSDRKP